MVIIFLGYFQAFELQSSEKGHHDYLYISLFVLLGIWLFFMIERIIKINLAHQSLKVSFRELLIWTNIVFEYVWYRF